MSLLSPEICVALLCHWLLLFLQEDYEALFVLYDTELTQLFFSQAHPPFFNTCSWILVSFCLIIRLPKLHGLQHLKKIQMAVTTRLHICRSNWGLCSVEFAIASTSFILQAEWKGQNPCWVPEEVSGSLPCQCELRHHVELVLDLNPDVVLTLSSCIWIQILPSTVLIIAGAKYI